MTPTIVYAAIRVTKFALPSTPNASQTERQTNSSIEFIQTD